MSRDIDVQIAEKVMMVDYNELAEKFARDHLLVLAENFDRKLLAPHYSTNIADAWQVVEKLKSKGIYLCIEICQEKTYVCTKNDPHPFAPFKDSVWAETAPMAIALISLKTLGVERGKEK